MLKDRPMHTHRPMMTKKTPEQPSVHRNSNTPHHGSLPQEIRHQSRKRTSDRAPASLRNLSDIESGIPQMQKQYMKTHNSKKLQFYVELAKTLLFMCFLI